MSKNWWCCEKVVQERSDENAQEEKYQGTAKTSFEEKEIKEEHLKEKESKEEDFEEKDSSDESKEEDFEEMRKSFEIGGNTLIILFCLIMCIYFLYIDFIKKWSQS